MQIDYKKQGAYTVLPVLQILRIGKEIKSSQQWLVYYKKHNSKSKNKPSVITATNKKEEIEIKLFHNGVLDISQSYDVDLCVTQSASLNQIRVTRFCLYYL